MSKLPIDNRVAAIHGRPLRLNHRHYRIAELMAMGFTNREMMSRLKMTATRLSIVTRHPQIVAMADALRAQYRERSIGKLHDDLEHDARNTFDKLKTHRENTDPDVSLKACGLLWDRQVPKRTISDETHTTRIVIEKKEVVYLKQVIDESEEPPTIDAV